MSLIFVFFFHPTNIYINIHRNLLLYFGKKKLHKKSKQKPRDLFKNSFYRNSYLLLKKYSQLHIFSINTLFLKIYKYNSYYSVVTIINTCFIKFPYHKKITIIIRVIFRKHIKTTIILCNFFYFLLFLSLNRWCWQLWHND